MQTEDRGGKTIDCSPLFPNALLCGRQEGCL